MKSLWVDLFGTNSEPVGFFRMMIVLDGRVLRISEAMCVWGGVSGSVGGGAKMCAWYGQLVFAAFPRLSGSDTFRYAGAAERGYNFGYDGFDATPNFPPSLIVLILVA